MNITKILDGRSGTLFNLAKFTSHMVFKSLLNP